MSEQPSPFPFATEIPKAKDVLSEGKELLKEMARYKEIVADQEVKEIISSLPTIIGYVPEAEREAFKMFMPMGSGASVDSAQQQQDRLGQLQHVMPETFRMLQEDMDQLGIPGLALNDIDVRGEFTRELPEQDARPWPLHGDMTLYLFRDEKKPTEFMQGRAKVKGNAGNFYVEDMLDNVSPLTAPPFAILRKPPLSIHRASLAKETGSTKIILLGSNLGDLTPAAE